MPAGQSENRSVHEERVRLALNAANIGTWEWDPRADRVEWSEDFERQHGFEPGSFGSSLSTYQRNIHPSDVGRVVSALRTCAESGIDYRVTYRLITPSGAIRFVDANGSRLVDEHGHFRLIGVCRDVTDQTQLLESIPQQVWTAQPDGALDFVNGRAIEYFGSPASEIIGAGWQSVVHRDDLPGVAAKWQQSVGTGLEYEVEFRLRRHDGIYRWHLGRAVPVRDGDRIVRWLGTNTDIHERKRVLAFMTTQVEISKILVDAHSVDGVANGVLHVLCRELDWNLAQLWVIDRGENAARRSALWCAHSIDTKSLEEIRAFDRMAFGVGLPGRIWETKKAAWIEDLERDANFPRAALMARAGLRSGFGFPVVAGGDVTAVLELFSVEPRSYEPDTVEFFSTFGGNIGQFIQRIAAEEELSDTLRQLRRLQAVTDVALANLSLGGLFDNISGRICEAVECGGAVIFLVDAASGELYAASSSENAGVTRDDHIQVGQGLAGEAARDRATKRGAHEQKPEFDDAIAVPLQARDRLLGVLLIGRPENGRFREADVTFAELIAQRLASAIDNAELYEQARESNRLKDRFLSIASHELKTPMTGIIGWTALLKKDDDPELRAEAIEWIERSARAQAQLIDEFLDAARIREGKLVLKQEDVDLADVVAETVRVVTPAALERGVELRLSVPETVRASGDRSRLQQVLWNLLSNSIKFTPPKGNVYVSVHQQDSAAVISVRDEGPGVPMEFLPKMFDAFEQDDRGRKAGGLGLGLHIAGSIVKLHGGTIEATNEGGAKFTVRLPLRSQAS